MTGLPPEIWMSMNLSEAQQNLAALFYFAAAHRGIFSTVPRQNPSGWVEA